MSTAADTQSMERRLEDGLDALNLRLQPGCPNSEAARIQPVAVSIISSQVEERKALGRVFCSESVRFHGAYSHGDDALRRMPANERHLVVIDLQWLGTPAIHCVRQIKGRFRSSKTILLFGPGYETCEWLRAGLQAGADGLLARPFAANEALAVGKSVLEHGCCIAPGLLRRLPEWFGLEVRPDDPWRLFSIRESEIIALSALGLGDTQIAQWLRLSKHTVDTHWRKLYRRFGVHSRTAILLFYLRRPSSLLPPILPATCQLANGI